MAERPLQREAAATSTPAEYVVRREIDAGELRRVLTPRRAYAAYALGQLQPDLFERSEWWSSRAADGEALLLHSRGGLGNALFAIGSAEALEAVLRLHPGPSHTFLTCQVHQLDTMVRHYYLAEQESTLRMLVDRETFRAPEGRARPLTGRRVHQINRLYRAEGTPAFYTARNIDDAVYHGAYVAEELVAVAGSHVLSSVDGIAVVGNVFTHPRHRGRGLGTLATGAVTEQLLRSCRDVVLSVDPRNRAAVRAYEKLGYREVGRLIEGSAERRDFRVGAFLRRRMAGLRGRRYGAELVNISA